MYPHHVQEWLAFGQGLLIFLLLGEILIKSFKMDLEEDGQIHRKKTMPIRTDGSQG